LLHLKNHQKIILLYVSFGRESRYIALRGINVLQFLRSRKM
jgi:hypothetical protein